MLLVLRIKVGPGHCVAIAAALHRPVQVFARQAFLVEGADLGAAVDERRGGAVGVAAAALAGRQVVVTVRATQGVAVAEAITALNDANLVFLKDRVDFV